MYQPTRIKSCPHCGGKAHLSTNYSYHYRGYFVYVKCDLCGAQGKVYTSATEPAADDWESESCEAAITAWNMRTKETEEKSE